MTRKDATDQPEEPAVLPPLAATTLPRGNPGDGGDSPMNPGMSAPWVLQLDRLTPWRPALSRLSDALMLLVAMGAALVIWNLRAAGQGYELPPAWFAANANWLLLWFILAVIGLNVADIYTSTRTTTWISDLYGAVSALSIASVLTLAIGYLVGEQSNSRLFFVLVCMLSVVSLLLWRLPARLLLARLRLHGVSQGRVLVIGSGANAQRLIQTIAGQPSLGYQVIGYADDSGDLTSCARLGGLSDLGDIIIEHDIHEVVMAGNALPHAQIMELMRFCGRNKVALKLMPDLYEQVLTRVSLEQLHGYPLVCLTQPHWHISDYLKRAMDLVIAASALLALSPIYLLVSLLIRLDSPGPIIFRQTRVGRHGRHFTLYKFRSMHINAESQLEALRKYNEVTGPIFKMKQDPRVTRVGRWLRKTSLDELPQLLNVIKGDMSLVGPRPAVPAEVAQYTDWQRGRLDCIPGITGLWQVSGRSKLTFEQMVQLDLDYIQRRTLLLDLLILIRTIPAVLAKDGAY